MKKITSVLLVLCCLTLSIAPALATEKRDLTDGEMLALHFINEFFSSKPEDGISYDVSLDTETNCFVVKGEYMLLESLYKSYSPEYQELLAHISELFSSVDSLMRTSVGSDSYYLRLTYFHSAIASSGAYCAFSSKGGTPHQVNGRFASNAQTSYRVADERYSEEDLQYIVDKFSGDNVNLLSISISSIEPYDKPSISISVSGEYCKKMLDNYKPNVSCPSAPDRYVIDCREIANTTGASCVILWLYGDSDGYACVQFSHSSRYAQYYVKDYRYLRIAP